MDSDEMSTLCVGCALYQRIVKRRVSFCIGGRTDACDFLALQIADPLITSFISNYQWLLPARDLTDCWFVRHPITFKENVRRTLFPTPQAAIQRNRVRLWRASEILKGFGIDAEHQEIVLKHLTIEWTTGAGGRIYSIDELLSTFNATWQMAEGLTKLGLSDIALGCDQIAVGIQRIVQETQK